MTNLSSLAHTMPKFYGYKKFTSFQKSTLEKVWGAYSLAKNLNFNEAFGEYNYFVVARLNEKFKMKILPSMSQVKERKLSFSPMGLAYCHLKKIELNSTYAWANASQWSEIFWHEMGHLIDSHGLSHALCEDLIVNQAKNVRKIIDFNSFANKNEKETLFYYTKPSINEKIKNYDRVISEVFAESFGLMMTVLTLGTQAETINCLLTRQKFIKVYLPVIEKMISFIKFNEMGLKVSAQKKKKLKMFFKEISNLDLWWKNC